jgi:hypothetical protein
VVLWQTPCSIIDPRKPRNHLPKSKVLIIVLMKPYRNSSIFSRRNAPALAFASASWWMLPFFPESAGSLSVTYGDVSINNKLRDKFYVLRG